MHPDVQVMQHAATTLITGTTYEEQKLDELTLELIQRLAGQASRGQLYRSITTDPYADGDDIMLATGAYWEAYDEAPVIERVELDVDKLRRLIGLRHNSATALAAALLQIGRDLIAGYFLHGSKCPTSRTIGTQELGFVIWEGRNQAMHAGDPSNYLNPVENCFATLAAEVDPAFALGSKPDNNHAYRLVKALGWTTFTDFGNDMTSLLPPSLPAPP